MQYSLNCRNISNITTSFQSEKLSVPNGQTLQLCLIFLKVWYANFLLTIYFLGVNIILKLKKPLPRRDEYSWWGFSANQVTLWPFISTKYFHAFVIKESRDSRRNFNAFWKLFMSVYFLGPDMFLHLKIQLLFPSKWGLYCNHNIAFCNHLYTVNVIGETMVLKKIFPA